jgi:hypothetical protein
MSTGILTQNILLEHRYSYTKHFIWVQVFLHNTFYLSTGILTQNILFEHRYSYTSKNTCTHVKRFVEEYLYSCKMFCVRIPVHFTWVQVFLHKTFYMSTGILTQNILYEYRYSYKKHFTWAQVFFHKTFYMSTGILTQNILLEHRYSYTKHLIE